jgi:hypothetical protein
MAGRGCSFHGVAASGFDFLSGWKHRGVYAEIEDEHVAIIGRDPHE